MARSASLAAIFIGVFLAAALADTRFHLVGVGTASWHGLSDPPSTARLLTAASLAGLAAWLFRGRSSAGLPLAALGVSALPLAPALTGHFPLLLAAQGPALAIPTGAALCVCARRAWPSPAPFRRGLPTPLLFAVPFLAYLALGTRLPGPAGPQGDEPHYLVMAQSLWSDGDLELSDEFAAREYASFYPGTLVPHTSPRSPHGRIYSIHAPGLPVLLLPAYGLAGYRGAQLLVSALAAAMAVLAHRLGRRLTGSDAVATAAWAAVAFLPPLPFYAVAIYPEVPAALGVAALCLLPGSGSRHRLALASLTASLLPWLHPKLLPVAFTGLLLVLAGAGPRRARAAAALAPLVSLGLLLWFFEVTYGEASLAAAYGPGLASDLALANLLRGATGLFFDRQFGLLIHAPFWILAAPGAAYLYRRDPAALGRLLLLGVAGAGMGAAFSMWWGGACPPARFLVPVLPVIAVLGALAAVEHKDLAAGLFGASFAVVLLAAEAPRALHNRPDGESALLRRLAPALELDPYLPSFVTGDRHGAVTIALAAVIFTLLFLGRRRVAAAVLLGSMALVAFFHEPALDQQRAALELLRAWDETNILSTLPTAWPGDLEIPISLPGAPWLLRQSEARASRRIELPPGSYRLLVDGCAPLQPGAPPAHLRLLSDSLLLAERTLGTCESAAEIPLFLPTGVRRLSFVAAGAGAAVRTATIAAQEVLPRRRRADFSWPLAPAPESYRVGTAAVRATALDRSVAEGSGFRLVGRRERFIVEAAPGSAVLVRFLPGKTAGAPGSLSWGQRQVPLPGAAELRLSADEGSPLGGLRLVPVSLDAPGSHVTFSAAPSAPGPG